MPELIYSPGISVLIDSALHGIIDVSEDVENGDLSLNENSPHALRLTLTNARRKYDGVFAPNDRITVRLKRIRWMQVFTGYLDTVPYFSVYPGSVALSASCTMKVLKYFPWDARSVQAIELINQRNREGDKGADGGMAALITTLLTEVGRWPSERIHIGGVPTEWRSKFQKVYDAVQADYDATRDRLGANPIIAGQPIAGVTPGGGGFSSTTPGATATSADEKMTFTANDIDVILATIREVESGNNYTAINNGDGKGGIASGAYQFVTGTWDNYRGYKDAYLAPPDVQDAKASEMVRAIMSSRGPVVVNVPYSWYYPAVFRDPSLLDKIPAANEGNKLTIRQYGLKWLSAYINKYQELRGQDPRYVGVNNGYIGTPYGATPNSGTIRYPIPDGMNQLKSAESAWGGYQNGYVPQSALRYSKNTGMMHPVAGQAWDELCVEAEKAGLDLRGSSYRDIAGQDKLKDGMGVKIPGTSNHGWGLAIDVTVLVPSQSGRYPSSDNTKMYSTPEYQWLKQNAYLFGFGNPSWGQQGGSKPEAWHWEFLAFPNFKNGGVPGGTTGYNPFADAQNLIPGGSGSLFAAINFWTMDIKNADTESPILTGYRALMNDVPLITVIEEMVGAAGRHYCAAPNGDFIAWFPDFWGEYGLAGRVDVELIELKDFTVSWSDDSLITHQFVEGSLEPGAVGVAPTGIVSDVSNMLTRGIVTVDMQNVLTALTNVASSEYPWLKDPAQFLDRFGARVRRDQVPTIAGGEQTFWYAVNQFTHAWASQFSCSVPMTFMPELFPGMLLRIPAYGVQFYVAAVSHRWDMSNESGFTTTAVVMAPSAMDGSGFYLFPKSASFVTLGNGGGGGPVRLR